MGEILLAQPLSTAWLAWLSILIAAAVLTALFAVSYTHKERVTGQLALDKGLVKIYAQSLAGVVGIVTKKWVKEGDEVVAGQPLFEISIDRVISSRGNTQAEMLLQIQSRKKYLQQERDKQSQVLQRDEEALRQRIAFVQQEVTLLKQEIETQSKRLRLQRDAWERSKELLKQEFVSAARVDELEQDLLAQQLRQQNDERNLTTMQKEQNQLKSDLKNFPLTAQNRLSEFARQISELDQEMTDGESRRQLVVNAPQAGKITTVLIEVGQTTQPDRPLAALLPVNATLQADLYLPSRAYGFVGQDMPVLMRYPAYPYQKFGQYGGKVLEIGRTALSTDELRMIGQASTEPFYRVRVALDAQTVQAYGKAIALQDGLQVEADILIDTRQLYEWVLEPLYSVTGKL
jgi:membrane fusion protein